MESRRPSRLSLRNEIIHELFNWILETNKESHSSHNVEQYTPTEETTTKRSVKLKEEKKGMIHVDYLAAEEERIFRDHPVQASEFSDILFGTRNARKEFRRIIVMYNDCLNKRTSRRRFDSEELKCHDLIVEIGHFLQKHKDHAALRFSLMNTMEEMFRSLSILIDDYPSRLF